MTGQSFKFILVFTREIAAHNFGHGGIQTSCLLLPTFTRENFMSLYLMQNVVVGTSAAQF